MSHADKRFSGRGHEIHSFSEFQHDRIRVSNSTAGNRLQLLHVEVRQDVEIKNERGELAKNEAAKLHETFAIDGETPCGSRSVNVTVLKVCTRVNVCSHC